MFGFGFVCLFFLSLFGWEFLVFNIPFHSDIIWGKLFPSYKHESICFHLQADILCTVLSFLKYLCSHAEMGKSA